VAIVTRWRDNSVYAAGHSTCLPSDKWDEQRGYNIALGRAIADAARQIVQLDWHETQAKRAEGRRLASIAEAKARVDAMRAADAAHPEQAAVECRALEENAVKMIAEQIIDAARAAELGMCTEQPPDALTEDAAKANMTPRAMQDAGMVASPFSPDDPLVLIEGKLDRVMVEVDRLMIAVDRLCAKIMKRWGEPGP
jgi:hypothetical protein